MAMKADGACEPLGVLTGAEIESDGRCYSLCDAAVPRSRKALKSWKR